MSDYTDSPDVTRVTDQRKEPFVRMDPERARTIAGALYWAAVGYRRDARAAKADDDGSTECLLDRADEVEREAAYFRGWADAWDPEGAE